MPIFFIRHGQSAFNAAFNSGDNDPMLYDAPLSEKGRRQAEDTRAQVADLGIEHVITSPLTRAIQTALALFENTAPITVSAVHRELLIHSCDIGRTPVALQSDFPQLSFGHLDTRWWHQGPTNGDGVPVEPEEVFLKRIRAFANNLDQITDRPLAIVGHGNAFKSLIGRMLENCEVHRYRPKDFPSAPVFPREDSGQSAGPDET